MMLMRHIGHQVSKSWILVTAWLRPRLRFRGRAPVRRSHCSQEELRFTSTSQITSTRSTSPPHSTLQTTLQESMSAVCSPLSHSPAPTTALYARPSHAWPLPANDSCHKSLIIVPPRVLDQHQGLGDLPCQNHEGKHQMPHFLQHMAAALTSVGLQCTALPPDAPTHHLGRAIRVGPAE